MTDKNQGNEIEAKFCLLSFQDIEKKLIEIGGLLIKPRHHERNLRFDTPHQELTRNHRVLRLRQDKNIHLTFKGAAEHVGGISKRREIEFQANNFTSANKFLKALGYDVSVIYEKYRTTYQLDEFEITFDEMPYGLFLEIEGPDVVSIQGCANKLDLNWGARLSESYLTLFYRLKNALNLDFRDLTFENFKGIDIQLEDLAIQAADQ
ncbi:MAG: class IV adenylate cyclase [Chloroflexi bacterium]|jgi:adenylate cyclase, class 2|nr:class IV adenylate cyclase [Chloroflexota bacterium]MBT4003641.1 class IV adenylate cyclase [Chloroflexota bacterium]MBT4305845.1 class IV adenylate cyclase [Chloroflexota bacterium]MBT4533669.1 class IV adenylate cyclase [Chloroflexota bacterium]MBT4681688.1 class IV adenylate cyclase [Chloroflexota bacterium]